MVSLGAFTVGVAKGHQKSGNTCGNQQHWQHLGLSFSRSKPSLCLRGPGQALAAGANRSGAARSTIVPRAPRGSETARAPLAATVCVCSCGCRQSVFKRVLVGHVRAQAEASMLGEKRNQERLSLYLQHGGIFFDLFFGGSLKRFNRRLFRHPHHFRATAARRVGPGSPPLLQQSQAQDEKFPIERHGPPYAAALNMGSSAKSSSTRVTPAAAGPQLAESAMGKASMDDSDDGDFWEGRQGHGPVNGGQKPHGALRVVVDVGLVGVVVVVVVVLVFVQGQLVVVLVGVHAGGVLVVVVLVGNVAGVVVRLGVMSVHVIVVVSVVVGVVVGVPVAAARRMVVCVVVVAVGGVLLGVVVVSVALGVVVDVLVRVPCVGGVRNVMGVAVCVSYLGLKDLTIYIGVLNTIGIGEEGSLTEAVVLRREEQGKANLDE
ncbi:hypothetical protein EYF80_012880 [Liparis tanakae]|uniref:Uncharacterized protein n=1 Tax=Liparis tanakae TaxID=230148 RepID=A0A4Z2IGB7_9TELE|nr:hypothetical protein EYF80_012880 [Liparis tanakae]